jgi:hypothetical protein
MGSLFTALGRLILISSAAFGIASYANWRHHTSYWNGTIERVQTVDFNMLAHMLPTKLSQALIEENSQEIQRTLDSNYGLFGLVVTDCEIAQADCFNQRIRYISNSSLPWREQLSEDNLSAFTYDLLRDPPPLYSEGQYSSARDHIRQATGQSNTGEIIGRVYYVRGVPPAFFEAYLKWIRGWPDSFLSDSGANRYYALTIALLGLGGLWTWICMESIYSKRHHQNKLNKQLRQEALFLRQQFQEKLIENQELTEQHQQVLADLGTAQIQQQQREKDLQLAFQDLQNRLIAENKARLREEQRQNELQEAIQQQQHEAKLLQEQIKTLQAQQPELYQEKQQLQRKITELQQEEHNQQNQLTQYMLKLNHLEQQFQKTLADKEELIQQHQQALAELNLVQSQQQQEEQQAILQDLQIRLDAQNDARIREQQQRIELYEAIQKQQQDAELLRRQIAELQAQKPEKDKENQHLREKIIELQQEQQTKRTRIEHYTVDLERLKQELIAQSEEKDKTAKLAELLHHEVDEAKRQQAEAVKQTNNLRQLLDCLSHEREIDTEKLRILEAKLESEKQQVNELKELISDVNQGSLNYFEKAVINSLKETSEFKSSSWLVVPQLDVSKQSGRRKPSSSQFTDCIVIGQSFIVVIEAKHYSGRIRSEGDVQRTTWHAIQKNQGEIEILSFWGNNPYQQVDRYTKSVIEIIGERIGWKHLTHNKVCVYGVVVFPDSADLSLLDTELGSYYRVTKLKDLVDVIRDLAYQTQCRAKKERRNLPPNEIKAYLSGSPLKKSETKSETKTAQSPLA